MGITHGWPMSRYARSALRRIADGKSALPKKYRTTKRDRMLREAMIEELIELGFIENDGANGRFKITKDAEPFLGDLSRITNEWSEKEIALLVERYPLYGTKYLAIRLGRTRDAVKKKAMRLGLKCDRGVKPIGFYGDTE